MSTRKPKFSKSDHNLNDQMRYWVGSAAPTIGALLQWDPRLVNVWLLVASVSVWLAVLCKLKSGMADVPALLEDFGDHFLGLEKQPAGACD